MRGQVMCLCVSVGEQVSKLSGRRDDLQMTRLEMIYVCITSSLLNHHK